MTAATSSFGFSMKKVAGGTHDDVCAVRQLLMFDCRMSPTDAKKETFKLSGSGRPGSPTHGILVSTSVHVAHESGAQTSMAASTRPGLGVGDTVGATPMRRHSPGGTTPSDANVSGFCPIVMLTDSGVASSRLRITICTG